MDLEFHQLNLRFEKLRARRPAVERRLLASLAEIGQQMPVVVVKGDETMYVLVDGYKRVRALRRLRRDVVRATCWDLDPSEALLLERLMSSGEGATALEQAWLLRELSQQYALSLEEMGRRFGRSASWVSRRLALIVDLPEIVQERVRQGQLSAHAAMRYLVPLARVNPDDCRQLVEGIAEKDLSVRQVGALYEGWRDGLPETRERILDNPMLFLRAREDSDAAPSDGCRLLLRDFDILASVTRRSARRLRDGAWGKLLPPEHEEVSRGFEMVRDEMRRLERKMRKETEHAG